MSTDLRVQRDQRYNELLEELTDGPFERMADALVFAACIALPRLSRRPVDKKAEPIRLNIFEDRGHMPFLELLAFCAAEDLEILADDQLAARVLIFEEFANGGLEILEAQRGLHTDWAEACFSLLQEYRPSREPSILDQLMT